MGAFDWLTTGEGTPWGPTKFGKPADYTPMTDPSQVTGVPDLSAQRQALQQQVAKQGAGARQALQGQMGAAGINAAGAGQAQGNIAEQQAEGLAQGEAGINQQDFQNRMGVMDALNQAKLMKYMADSGNYDAEQNQRNNFWNTLTGAGEDALSGGLKYLIGAPAAAVKTKTH